MNGTISTFCSILYNLINACGRGFTICLVLQSLYRFHSTVSREEVLDSIEKRHGLWSVDAGYYKDDQIQSD
jgi:hypothetical protein